MSLNMSTPTNSIKCVHHLLYSVVYGSLCILLVLLGVVWCSSSHQQTSQLVTNLQNHRLSDEPLPPLNSQPSEFKESRISKVEVEQLPMSVRRSYQSSGFGDEYGNIGNGGYGSQMGYQQNYQPNYPQSYQQNYQQNPQRQQSSQYMYPPGAGSYYPGYSGSYYPGLDRFLSLFPQRSLYGGQQPYNPYGGSYGGQYGGQYGGYPYNYGYGGLGGPYGSLMRLSQATSLLSGIRNSYKERLNGLNTGIENQST